MGVIESHGGVPKHLGHICQRHYEFSCIFFCKVLYDIIHISVLNFRKIVYTAKELSHVV